MTTSSTVLS